MQANQLWSGTDYAYINGRGRGQTYSATARRVRVIRVFQEKADRWSERATTYAQVNMLTNEGELIMKDDTELVRNVRARDIVNYWDEYADEHERRIKEAEEVQLRIQQQKIKEQAENEAIEEHLYKLGIPRGAVKIQYTRVSMDREVILNWIKQVVS